MAVCSFCLLSSTTTMMPSTLVSLWRWSATIFVLSRLRPPIVGICFARSTAINRFICIYICSLSVYLHMKCFFFLVWSVSKWSILHSELLYTLRILCEMDLPHSLQDYCFVFHLLCWKWAFATCFSRSLPRILYVILYIFFFSSLQKM